jgi:hypothetical protein
MRTSSEGHGVEEQSEDTDARSSEADTDTDGAAAQRTDEVDFLIELREKLAEGYADRCERADGIAGGVLTACVSVAALIVAANATLALTNRTVAIIALIVLGLSALAAAWARSGAGLRPLSPANARGPWRIVERRAKKHADNLDKGSLLSHESPGFRTALRDLRAKSAELPDGLHKDALGLWAAREQALHRTARSKEQAAGAAGMLLVVAILLTAALSIMLVLDQPQKAKAKHASVPVARRTE